MVHIFFISQLVLFFTFKYYIRYKSSIHICEVLFVVRYIMKRSCNWVMIFLYVVTLYKIISVYSEINIQGYVWEISLLSHYCAPTSVGPNIWGYNFAKSYGSIWVVSAYHFNHITLLPDIHDRNRVITRINRELR